MTDTFSSRRDFLASTTATAAAASVVGLGAGLASAEPVAGSPSVDGPSLIHLFLPGGWPCNDLWDPKPHAPFRPGMRGSELTATVPTIETACSAIRLGEPLGHVSTIIDRGVIIRSLIDETRTTDHATAQHRMLAALSFGLEITEIAPDLSQSHGLAQALLAATKLTAQGNLHVRVTLPFESYQSFDAHESGGDHLLAEPMQTIDMVIAAIVHQLEATGQLDRTIFCISSEFSRTIAGNPVAGSDLNTGENLIIATRRDYGFHAHFAEANCLVLFGGPFKRGHIFGRTAPKHPMRAVENPVTLADVHATLATALGGTPREGRVIADLFA